MTGTSLRHTLRLRARLGAVRGACLTTFFILLAFALVGAMPRTAVGEVAVSPAKTGAQRVDAVEAELVADVARARPGEPFRLGLRLKHDPHWHTYWRNPGDSGLPTRFEPSGPAGVVFGDIVWPAPRRLAIGDLANYGYEGEVVLAREVTLPPGFDARRARFEVQAQWLVCREVCIPGEAALAIELPVGDSAQAAPRDLVARFDDSARNAPQAGARLDAGWWQQGSRAWLLLPEGTAAGRAEFFPYFEGVVRPAAPQSLVASGAREAAGAQGERLALRLEAVAGAEGGLPSPPAGVVLLDGTAVEVGLQPLGAEPADGSVLSVAEVAPSAPPASRGLLERLRGGVGGSSAVGPAPSPGVAAKGTAAARPFPSAAGGAASGTLLIALGGALLGGLILNLMPCVFPVIGLKVLSFSQAAAGSPRLARRHALSFGAGVVLSFVALGLVMLALRFAGDAAGWGFQMQSPVFVGAMALLFVLIGLNLFGVFETGISLTRLPLPSQSQVTGLSSATGASAGGAGQGASQSASQGGGPGRRGHGLLNSFGTGIVAVLVATPCTAPFMGSAVGYTLSSPPVQTLLVFATLGLGMALPYLVLAWAPRLLRWLPRPGAWLTVFKQLLAFPMLATAAWLAWVLTLQAGADGLLRLLMSAILVAFAAWVYGRAQQATFRGRSRPGLVGFAAAVVAALLTVWQLVQIGSGAPASASASAGASAGAASIASSASSGANPSAGAGGPSSDAASSSARLGGPASEPAGDVRAEAAREAGDGGEQAGSPAQWQPWSPQKVSQALAQGRPVMVDFTAAWCISCQANKKLVLEREAVRRAFDANNVALLRADWTRRDPAITAALASFGRNGVPLYLVYLAADEPPLMLPELLTVDIVLAALNGGR